MHKHALVLSFLLGFIGAFGAADASADELDCDNNGVPDAEELSGNDCNANGLLDVCENDTVVAVTGISGIRQDSNVGFQHGNIDVDGRFAVVGRPANFVPGAGYQPRVDCYEYSPQAGWQLVQSIVEAGAGQLGAFGDRVDVCGDRLVVTAPKDGYPASQQGAVYCYRRIDGDWQFQQKLNAKLPGGRIGEHVVLDANRLFVSETQVSSLPVIPRIDCYVDRGAGFELEQTIQLGSWVGTIGNVLGGVWFGAHDNVLIMYEPQPREMLVPSPPTPPNGFSDALCAVIYEWSQGKWTPVQRVVLGDLKPTDFRNCFVEENRIIVTPLEYLDVPFGSNVAVIEKGETGWSLAHAIYLPSEFPGWVEKSDDGYFVGANELILGEDGPAWLERPDLGGVEDRGNRSGNWWGVVIDDSAFPYPISNISRIVSDCDSDGILDECEIAAGAPDVDLNLVPDACQEDCNADGIPDVSQMASGDCNANGVLDVCDLDPLDPDGDGVTWADCNQNGTPDVCEADCDGNGVPDDCDLDPADPDGDGLVADDCNANGRPDACDIDGGMVLTAEIRPSVDAAAFSFGFSISLDGDVLVAGCPAESRDAPIADRVFVYRRNGERWNEEAVILPDNLAEDLSSFGYWVAVGGDRLVIKGEGQYESGTAYLYTYEYDGTGWQYASTIAIPQSIIPTSDMVIDGGRLAVSTDDSRSITIYEYENGAWHETDVVSLLETDGYAERITLHDDLLIAGYGANESQIFRFDGTSWALIARSRHIGLTYNTIPLTGRPQTYGDLVVFGNRFGGCPRNGSPYYCGSAQVYRLVADDLILDDLLYGLSEGEPLAPVQFGSSTALVGDRLIVGSPGFDAGHGRIQLFERDGVNWTLRQTYQSPAAPNHMGLGYPMAASGDTLAVVATGLSIPVQHTADDAIFIYETDLDVDDDGILDTCETDCDGNHYPDDSERTIEGFVSALLHGGAACVFDMNDDGAVDGRDVAPFVDLLVTGP